MILYVIDKMIDAVNLKSYRVSNSRWYWCY